jgi:hypothetical protein
MLVKIVDPPSGWRYGFPKIMPRGLKTEEEKTQWFLDNNYPRDLIDINMLSHCRSWYVEL